MLTTVVTVDVNSETLHVVAKPPPSAPRPSTANIDSERPQPNTRTHMHGPHGPSTVVLGSYTVPSETVDPNQVQVSAQAQNEEDVYA